MSEDQLRHRIQAAGQEHVLRFWSRITPQQRQRLAAQLHTIDFNLVNELYTKLVASPPRRNPAALEPAEVITLAEQQGDPRQRQTMIELGEEAIAAGRVGALLVAGGQGSRLGFDGPKGMLAIASVTGKSLFQLHAEKLLALSRRHRVAIPFYIMTSQANHEATVHFFESNQYFGLPVAEVYFFRQGMMPAVDSRGQIILERPESVFLNPDGHGGVLTALKKSGALQDMQRRKLEHIFYFQVDNVLINLCDPLFIGYHLHAESEMSAKVCSKKHPDEKVGVVGRKNGRLTVIEYSEMSETDKTARNSSGSLKFNSGSIAIHLFSVEFLTREVENGSKLPWHVAHKRIPYVGDDGNPREPERPNGFKFESFIFDALSDARKTMLLEVDRAHEFSPIKNASGEDSPATAVQDFSNFYATWLEQCGVTIPRTSEGFPLPRIEISPLFALDVEELRCKLSADLMVGDELYLGE